MKKLYIILLLTLISMSNNINAQEVNFLWAKQIGGTSNEYVFSNAIDADGNVYTTGTIFGTADFDPGSGTYYLTPIGGVGAFISKLDDTGNFLWAKQFTGSSGCGGNSITLDDDGNVYITGDFIGTVDFDPGTGTYNLTSYNNSDDIYICKLNVYGNFMWAKQLGGSNTDSGESISIDANGNIITTGYFQGTADFDPGSGTYYMISSYLGSDAYISKLDNSGNFIWAKQLGGGEWGTFVIPFSIALDASGNIHTTGYFQSTVDFDPGPGTFYLTGSNYDVYISKLNASGNFVWAKQIGSTNDDYGNSVVIDDNGNVFTTGHFDGTVDFDPGPGTYNLTDFGSSDIFISKLDASGNFIWAKQLGGTSGESGESIALDDGGNIYTTGRFYGTADFDPGTGTYNLTSFGDYDVFISILNASGNFLTAIQLGGSSTDYGESIAVDPDGNVYTTGIFNGTADFDPGTGVYDLTSYGNNDIFISKLEVVIIPSAIISLTGDLSFGNVQIGNTSQLNFTISNIGSEDLIVSSISYPSPVFTGNWSGTIPPSGSQEVTVTFAPTEEITYSGDVSVYSNAGSGDNTIPISGTGTNTASSLISISTFIPDNPSVHPNPKILWSGNTNETPDVIKICADASTATKVTFTNNTGINSENIRFWIESDPYGNNPDLSGYFINYNVTGNTITAEFAHPKYLPSSYGLYRSDNILIVDYTNPDPPIFDINIAIFRAPVLFVHGIMGNAGAFTAMTNSLLDNDYYTSPLIKVINYPLSSMLPFSSNIDEIRNGINDLFYQIRSVNYSAGKVDIVSHSMGGIISRLYLQGNYDNTYRGDVNKLITLNTPHSGSQLANWIMPPLEIICAVSPLFRSISIFCNGAGADLQTDSYAIDHELNGTEYLLQGHVPSHTISSYIEDENIEDCLDPFTYGLLPIDPSDVPEIFGIGEQMDGVVRVDSQKGGLSGSNTSPLIDQCHLGAAANNDNIDEVTQLLCASPNDGQFKLNGFDPEDMKSAIPIPQIVYKNQTNEQINVVNAFVEITDPPGGSTFFCNQPITITVNSDISIDRLVLLIGNTSLGISQIDTTIVSTTNTVNYTIPSDAIGQMEIDVIGFDSTNIVAFDSVAFNVNTNATLNSIQLIPDLILVPVDNTNTFQVTGNYSDNVTRDLTFLPGVQFSTANNSIAMINSPGIIEGVSADSTLLIVTFQSVSDNIPVYVYEDYTFSMPLFSSYTNVICAESGQVTFYDLSSGNPQSIEWHFPGGNPTTSSDSIVSVYYSSPGLYDVSLIATYSTKIDTLSLAGYITVSIPPYSTLSLLNDTIFCSATDGSAYQWYQNGNPIYSTDLSYIHPDTIGEYFVDVMNEAGCIARSDTYYYDPLSIDYFLNNSNLSLYPNPTTGIFTLEVRNNEKGEIKVLNILGNIIYQSNISNSKSEINLSDFPAGIYSVHVQLGKMIYNKKLIVQ